MIKKAISLFSGAGGDSLGLKNAGYDVVAFSENNKFAIQTHLREFPNSTHLVDPKTQSPDITKIPDEVFEAYANKIDLVFAGFPCQSFSNAGKKRIDDPRGELVHQFIRAVRIIQPTWIIGENVAGLLSRGGIDLETKEEYRVIDVIQELFEDIGYFITYKVLSAVDFGIPQSRKRLVIVGSRDENSQMPWDKFTPLTTPLTIRVLLETHLDGAIEFNAECPVEYDDYWIETKETEPTGAPHPNLLRLSQGIRNLSTKEMEEKYPTQIKPDTTKPITRSDTRNAEQTKQTKSIKPPREKPDQIIVEGGLISFGIRKSSQHGQILDPDAVCKTIICTYGTCPRLFVGLRNRDIGRYWIRCLSIRELGQIQGFPVEYGWQGNPSEQIKQIGNAFPPAMCETIVRGLRTIEGNLNIDL